MDTKLCRYCCKETLVKMSFPSAKRIKENKETSKLKKLIKVKTVASNISKRYRIAV